MDIFWNIDFTWILAFLGIAFYFYSRWYCNIFARKGIKNIPFSIPYMGNMYKVFTMKEHFRDIVMKTYNAFPDQKYVGHMQFNQPMVMIRDLDILKQVAIKDFDHFLNHVTGLEDSLDPLFGNNLFGMKGDKWRDMRATLSPAFTSSKMRNMFQFVEEIGCQMTEFYLKMMKEAEHRERGLIEIEMRDAFTRYTNDVIATSVFGIKVNSLADRDNDFYKNGKIAANFSGAQLIKFFIMVSIPKLSKLLRLKLFSPDTANFFRNLVLGNMKEREMKHIVRHDMIQLLIEAQKGSLKHETESKEDGRDAGFATVNESHVGKQTSKRNWSSDEIVAQAVIFFLAGFDTSSTLLCFLANELAVNPDVQKKLQREIDGMTSKNGPKLEYNHLADMKYMDMVVSETLRMWPPAVSTDRQCIKPYYLPPVKENSPAIKMNVGDGIWIPIYGIHHDPKYYPNPSKFDPERFSEANKHQIDPSAFIPFGLGPRNCIGSRFALMETKAVIFHLLSKFDFVQTAKTEYPIQLANNTFNLRALNGFWLGLKPRCV